MAGSANRPPDVRNHPARKFPLMEWTVLERAGVERRKSASSQSVA